MSLEKGVFSAARSERGQMTVELAVMVPVCIVVALIVFNLVRFAVVCAEFDRVAQDAVISQGVAPSGEQSAANACSEVKACVVAALNAEYVDVSVTTEGVLDGEGTSRGIAFPVSPLLTRFVCTLRYQTWPRAMTLAGVCYAPPFVLEHSKSIVVDRYRAGVVV